MRGRQGIATAALLAACAPTTTLVSDWKDTDAGPIRFERTVAVCMCGDDAALRREVEDRLTRLIAGSEPAYTLLSDVQLQDRAAARARVRQAGFDGAIVLYLVGVERTATYLPGQPYIVPENVPAPSTTWGYGWNAVYDPGYVRGDQSVGFNVTVYSVADDKVLWAGRTETLNPSSVPAMVDDVVAAIAEKMKRQKFLP